MHQCQFPIKHASLLIPTRENREDCLVDRFIVAVLLHVVSVHWAHSVIRAFQSAHDQVKGLVIRVLFCLDEVLHEVETVQSEVKVCERVLGAFGGEIINQG